MSNTDGDRERLERLIAAADRVVAQKVDPPPKQSRWLPVAMLGAAGLFAVFLGVKLASGGDDRPSTVPGQTSVVPTAVPTPVVSTTMPVVITFPPTTAQTTTTVSDTTPGPSTTAWTPTPGVPVRSTTYTNGVFVVSGAVPDQQTADAVVGAFGAAAGSGNVQSTLLVAAGAPLVENEPLFAPDAIPFAPNSAALPASSAAFLDTLARLLQQNPTLTLDIAAFTNSVGTTESNLVLSQQRADAIYLYLIASGITPDRLTATGYGEGFPIADDNTEDGRNRNRRVEFTLHHLIG
ncbi:MAG: hypothetical protein RL238_3330 [Actinomycetota bacterium]|jgi:outer membrane protein OmpA-like peptidoglycan-associated protein